MVQFGREEKKLRKVVDNQQMGPDMGMPEDDCCIRRIWEHIQEKEHSDQLYEYSVTQNFNLLGRFVPISRKQKLHYHPGIFLTHAWVNMTQEIQKIIEKTRLLKGNQPQNYAEAVKTQEMIWKSHGAER
ncbi:hypothetical protein HAX54_050661 [Datura stramonium]|uniref:Uncharacterized protein n=1 Tax=Datura stramonium TaxID=4076 RepID=A0ABS8RQY9_DATST|nr:hypothetical protein [Datura stramonium]